MALPAIVPTTAPTAIEPIVPIMPDPAAAGAAAGAAATGAGAAAAGAGAAAGGAALAGAGADVRGADFMPMRLALANEGSVREATARATMERLVRKEAFMKSIR